MRDNNIEYSATAYICKIKSIIAFGRLSCFKSTTHTEMRDIHEMYSKWCAYAISATGKMMCCE